MAYGLDSYQEVAMLTLSQSGVRTNFALLTESFEVNNGEKAVESLPTTSGGRIMKWTPEGDTEFTAKIVPVGVGKTTDTTADGFWQAFQPQSAAQDTFPQTISASRNRNLYSVAILWASAFPTNAFTSTAASATAYRVILKNAYINKLTHNFSTSDGMMAEIAVKCPPFDKSGNPNIILDSTDGTAALINR